MTGSSRRSAAAQNGSKLCSSVRAPAIDVPISTPTAPASAASSSTRAESSASCNGTWAIQLNRSLRDSHMAASPALTARAIASPAAVSTS
jgi:hypothetical protein